MSKSIIIFGKGPSLLRCNREFVDQYDDIAICGFPPLINDFAKLVNNPTREIKYHFGNAGDPHLIKKNNKVMALYNDKVNEIFNISEFYDIGAGTNNYKKYLQNKNIFKGNIKEKYFAEFKSKYDFDKWGPSGGVYAIHHILKLKKYDKIALVGFDNFEQGKQRYYFDLKYINPSLHYIIGRDITLDNKTIIKTLHSSEKTTDYFKYIFTEFPNIDFTMYSNINFNEKYNNVTIF